MTPIQGTAAAAAGRAAGTGPVYLLSRHGPGGAPRRALPPRVASAFRSPKSRFAPAPRTYPAGSWILPAQDGLAAALGAVANELALDFESAPAPPQVAAHDAPIPRVAVWHLWSDTESVGWLRLALDQEKVPYDYIRDEEIRAGGLRKRWDVIVFGNNESSLKEQIHGIDPKFGPMPYKKTPETPNLGVPDSSEDITGGIGWGGVARLQEFLDAGGLLLALGNGSSLPIDGGLVRAARRTSGGPETPGVELRTKFTRPDHPLAYGYPAETSVFRSSLPAYDVPLADRRFMVMQWGTRPRKDEREDEPAAESKPAQDAKDAKDPKDPKTTMVVSGGMKNEGDLEGRPAILDLPAGKGRVIAFNFNPIHRDLNHSDYRMLWNGILNWNALPPLQP